MSSAAQHLWRAAAAAEYLRWFEPTLVPGLLQVESYARAVFRSDPWPAEAFGEVWAARQAAAVVLRRRLVAGEVTAAFVVTAAVLDPVVDAVSGEQAEHLDVLAGEGARIYVVPAGPLPGFVLVGRGDGVGLYREQEFVDSWTTSGDEPGVVGAYERRWDELMAAAVAWG